MIEVTDRNEWNSLVSSARNCHFLQSWQWGELKSNYGWKVFRYRIGPADKPTAAIQLLTRYIHPRIPYTIGYVSKGPAFFSSVAEQEVVDALKQLAKDHRMIYLKCDPEVLEGSPDGDEWANILRSNGWRYSSEQIQTKNTGISQLYTDEKDGEEHLLSDMKRRWRYNIRNAAKRGIIIDIGDADSMRDFYDLYKETGNRQSFGIRSLAYYEEVYERFKADDSNALILLSRHPEEEKPLSASVFIKFGNRVWYFYSASSERRRPDMPNYLLQWEALQWARAQGAITYDWGGASNNPDNPEDPLARIWHFKKGFGAIFTPSVGAWDYPRMTFAYRAYMTLRHIRKRK